MQQIDTAEEMINERVMVKYGDEIRRVRTQHEKVQLNMRHNNKQSRLLIGFTYQLGILWGRIHMEGWGRRRW